MTIEKHEISLSKADPESAVSLSNQAQDLMRTAKGSASVDNSQGGTEMVAWGNTRLYMGQGPRGGQFAGSGERMFVPEQGGSFHGQFGAQGPFGATFERNQNRVYGAGQGIAEQGSWQSRGTFGATAEGSHSRSYQPATGFSGQGAWEGGGPYGGTAHGGHSGEYNPLTGYGQRQSDAQYTGPNGRNYGYDSQTTYSPGEVNRVITTDNGTVIDESRSRYRAYPLDGQ